MNKDIKLSNIKGLLIFLVVFGHLISQYQQYYQGMYLFIYSFHMPLFVLVSGYFAKRVTYKKVLNLLAIYLIFQLLYRCFLLLIKSDKVFHLKYETPYYHLWYLVSLMLWYLLAIGIQKVTFNRRSKMILVAICFILGIVSRYFTGAIITWIQNYDSDFDAHTLSYQRTISFLPFFILGMLITKAQMLKLYHGLVKRKWIAFVIMAGIYFYYTFFESNSIKYVLKGSYGVNQIKGTLFADTGKIGLSYLIAIIMCYCLLCTMSSKQNILTKWGDRTMPIYLFHMFIVRTIKEIFNFDSLNRWILLCILVAFTFAIVSFAGSNLFVKLTYYLCNPYELMKLIRKKCKTNLQPLE